MNTVQQAFGSNLAQELIQSYDGSNLVADSQQDLVGERYLAEQIRLIQEQQRTTSVLDKWGHLLYEGEKDYVSASKSQIPPLNLEEQNYTSSVTLERKHNQDQADYLHQLQKIQEQQKQQFFRQQQLQEQIDQQQLRHSQSQNLVHSNSYQRAASAASTMPTGYVHSQSGLNGRTLSDIKLSQLKANQLATAQYRAQYEAQMESMTKAEAIAHAYAQAQAEIASQNEAFQSEAYAQIQQEQEQQEFEEEEQQEQENFRISYSRQSVEQARSSQIGNKLKKSFSGQQQQATASTKLSSSNLKSITIDAYNSPQFREMLEQLTKPLTIAPEQVNYPPEWPSQDKISTSQKIWNLKLIFDLFIILDLLAEPIYIPAPNPIVIPAPNILHLQNYNEPNLRKNNFNESN